MICYTILCKEEVKPLEYREEIKAAIDYIYQSPLLNNKKIVLYGQSIGGSVAIKMASLNQGKVYLTIL